MLKRFAVLVTVAALGASMLAVGTSGGPAGGAVTNSITITARDFAYVVDGKLRPGQAEVTFTNEGKEAHILAIFKLKSGKTLKDVKKALKSQNEDAFNKITSDPEGAYGYPFFLTPGGEATTVTELFTKGSYAMICFIADEKGKPHFLSGMVQVLKIAGKPATPEPVESDGTVVLSDTGIQVPPGPLPLTATVQVDNEGTTIHSYSIVKLNGDATLQDVYAFYNDTYQGGPLPADAPGEILSGVGDFPAGDSVYLSWKDLPPGRYAYVSISGDSESPEGDDFSKGLYGGFPSG